jgi:flavin reductase (DIM6/NTAB) family NADH-FMN oxidoreductase RutF
MELDPRSLAQPDRYKIMIGAIVPRPIALVATLSIDGRPNLAPFSFFNGVGSDPMTLLFCPANKPDGTEKDTLRNAKPIAEGGTAEFVVNIVSEPWASRMAACAEALDYGESEFDLSGLTPEPSRVVKPPRVRESLVSFECRTTMVVRTNPLPPDGRGVPSGGNIVVGEVVHIRLAEGIANERWHIDPAKIDAIGRMGGLSYCRTRDRFDLPMGRGPLHGT